MADENASSGMTNPLAGQSGDTLVTWGALLVLASWVIFEVIVEEYFLGTAVVAVALLIAVVPMIDADAITGVAPTGAFLKLAGYLLVALGVVEVVADLRTNIFDDGAASIIGALVAWVGYVVAYMGARAIKN
jgi:hypothetical protein